MLNLRPVWGIDIGDSALKAVKLKRVGKQIVLLDFQVINYSDLTGDAGTRRDKALPQALAALSAAGLGKDNCLVSIPPQAIFSRFISLPPVDKRRIPEIVLYEARQQIPFSLNEVIWAYQTVRKEFVPGEEIEIGLFAVKRDVIDAYVAELTPIASRIHGIQVAPLALYNFIRHDVALEKPTVVMDVGAQSTDLLIVDGDRFWLRNLPIAGNSFTAVLEKRLNITREEAEKLKLGVGESRHRRKLLEVLRPVMRDMVGEIQRSIGYYKSLSQDVKFEEILVLGGGYRLFGLDRFLSERLQYAVKPLTRLEKLPYQGPPERLEELNETIPSLGGAIGLALQGMGQAHVTVDLLPDDFVIDRELHRKRFNSLIAAGLVCASVACFYMKESRALSQAREESGQGEGTLNRVTALDNDYKAARRPADPEKLKFYESFGGHRQYEVRLIDSVTRAIPRWVRIDASGFRILSGEEFGMSRGPAIGVGGGIRPGVGGLGRPRGGATDADETATEDKTLETVEKCKMRLQFTAKCDADREDKALLDELPNALEKAVMYAENVGPVVAVHVDTPVQQPRTEITDGASQTKDDLVALVTIGLRDAEEMEEARKEKREQMAVEDAKRKAEAARSRASASVDMPLPGD